MEYKRVVMLTAPDGVEFAFAPGALSLELCVTGGAAERAIFETLHRPADLRHWLSRTLEVKVSRVDESDLAVAKELREAVWFCAVARAQRSSLPARAVRRINECASAPPPVPRIDRSGSRAWNAPISPDQALSAIARDAVDVLAGSAGARIRQCEGERCTLTFLDTSRAGSRRWCSMDRCGNRAKAKAFRRRERDRSA